MTIWFDYREDRPVGPGLGTLAALFNSGGHGPVGFSLGVKTACSLAERRSELHPGARQSFADILGALAQRLGALPHLARRVARALTHIGKCVLGVALSLLAQLVKLKLALL